MRMQLLCYRLRWNNTNARRIDAAAPKDLLLGVIPALDFAIKHCDSESVIRLHSTRNFLPLTESHSAQPKYRTLFHGKSLFKETL